MDTVKLAWHELPSVTNVTAPDRVNTLFIHRRIRWLLRELWFGVLSGEVTVLTAPDGYGKTTVCESLLHRIPLTFYAVHLSAAEVAKTDSFERLANSLTRLRHGHDARQTDNTVATRRQYRLALVLDDAHKLELAALERLVEFREKEIIAGSMVAVLLIGQPSLEDSLRQPLLQRFNAQIALRCHLSALAAAESEAFIRHWFETHAGIKVQFTDAGRRIINFAAAGVPGNLDAICIRAWQYMRKTGKYSFNGLVATRAAWTLLAH